MIIERKRNKKNENCKKKINNLIIPPSKMKHLKRDEVCASENNNKKNLINPLPPTPSQKNSNKIKLTTLKWNPFEKNEIKATKKKDKDK